MLRSSSKVCRTVAHDCRQRLEHVILKLSGFPSIVCSPDTLTMLRSDATSSKMCRTIAHDCRQRLDSPLHTAALRISPLHLLRKALTDGARCHTRCCDQKCRFTNHARVTTTSNHDNTTTLNLCHDNTKSHTPKVVAEDVESHAHTHARARAHTHTHTGTHTHTHTHTSW
jgi:hypothetical protein